MPRRVWHTLGDEGEGRDGEEERGRVELLLWWHHNRENVLAGEDIELSDGEELAVDPRLANRPPNELRVRVVRARDVPVMDRKSIFEGGGADAADPFCVLRLGGASPAREVHETKVKKDTLRPRWDERFAWPLRQRELKELRDELLGALAARSRDEADDDDADDLDAQAERVKALSRLVVDVYDHDVRGIRAVDVAGFQHHHPLAQTRSLPRFALRPLVRRQAHLLAVRGVWAQASSLF